jgi:hypothetical protein
MNLIQPHDDFIANVMAILFGLFALAAGGAVFVSTL